MQDPTFHRFIQYRQPQSSFRYKSYLKPLFDFLLSSRYYSHCSTGGENDLPSRNSKRFIYKMTTNKITTITIGDNHKSHSFIFLLFVHYFRLLKRINALEMEEYGSLIVGQLLYNLCLLRSYSCMDTEAFTMHQNAKSNILAIRKTRNK
mgnify:CR=1 FL=1